MTSANDPIAPSTRRPPRHEEAAARSLGGGQHRDGGLEHRLDGIARLGVFLPPTCDPVAMRGTMVVATADHVVLTIGPDLVRRVAEAAPQFFDLSAASAKMLRLGEIDVVVGTIGVGTVRREEFDDEFPFSDDLVFMVDAGRDVAEPGEDVLPSSRFVSFCADRGDPASSFENVGPNQLGAKRFDAIRVMKILLLPCPVEKTDNVALTPRSLAERLAGSAPIRLVPPVRALPQVRVHPF